MSHSECIQDIVKDIKQIFFLSFYSTFKKMNGIWVADFFYMLINLKILVHTFEVKKYFWCHYGYRLIFSRITFWFSESLHSSQLLFHKVCRIIVILATVRALLLALKQNKTEQMQSFPYKKCTKGKHLEMSLIWTN